MDTIKIDTHGYRVFSELAVGDYFIAALSLAGQQIYGAPVQAQVLRKFSKYTARPLDGQTTVAFAPHDFVTSLTGLDPQAN